MCVCESQRVGEPTFSLAMKNDIFSFFYFFKRPVGAMCVCVSEIDIRYGGETTLSLAMKNHIRLFFLFF